MGILALGKEGNNCPSFFGLECLFAPDAPSWQLSRVAYKALVSELGFLHVSYLLVGD